MTPQPSSAEMAQARAWFEDHLSAAALAAGEFPVSWGYGDTLAPAPAPDWPGKADERGGEERVERTLTLVDPSSGLEIRCEASLFTDFPAVEWVVHLRNTGAADTPVVDDLLPLCAEFAVAPEVPCTLHHARGSECQQNDFEPLTDVVAVGGEVKIGSRAGRSSDPDLPFFNLQLGEGGVICAVGWTGGWRAEFGRSEEGVTLRSGMTRTHLRLHPGEEIRTPRMLLLFWEGDRRCSQNLLRRFLLAHHSPRPKGELIEGPICWAQWGEVRTADQLMKLRWCQEQGLPLDVFWIDAGWYGDAPFKEGSNVFNSQWYTQAGSWRPNRETYPDGFAPLGDACREAGKDLLVWIEPERCKVNTDLPREHPDWLLGPRGDNYLVDLGRPEALRGITELVSSLLTEGGITFYRQDFNTDPAPFWEEADAPDRVGMTEIGHITGLYAFWDALLERHPGLRIDNCSSGGRRIDLEMISRSIALWRSDYQCWPHFDPLGMQGQTRGLAEWVPLSAGAFDMYRSVYAMRSGLGAATVFGDFDNAAQLNQDADALAAVPVERLRQVLEEEVRVRPYFYGDFYPLLSYSLATDGWAAWQFDRPDLGEGMVQAFRRQDSPFATLELYLQGLNPEARYAVEDWDTGSVWEGTGLELAEGGFVVTLGERPSSALLVYRRV